MKLPVLICAGLLLSPAAALAAEPAPAMATGKSVNCVYLRDISSTEIKDNRTILFKMNGRKYYRNDLPHSCPGLRRDQAFSFKTSSSQLCSVDIIYVLENWGGTLQQTAGCGLGKFTEYTPPPKAAK